MAEQTSARQVARPAAPALRGNPWVRDLLRQRRLLCGGVVGVAAIAFIAGALFLRSGGKSQGGATGLAVLHTPDYHALAFSPTDRNVVFFGYHNGVMRSDDGGRSFHSLVSRSNLDAMNIAVSPSNAQQVYLAGHNVFQVSSDSGASWQPMTTNLPGTDIHGFSMSPDDPTHLTAFVVGYGIFASPDSGRTWQHLAGRVPSDVMSLTSAGGTPETLYAASMGSGILRSTDGGATFTPVAATIGRTVYTLAVDPTNRTTVYAGVEGGLYKSTDSGTNWSKLPYPGVNAAVVGGEPHTTNARTRD
jgi:hypothetical protein